MKKKLIKKYQAGGSPRLYNYLPLPPKDKWNGITSIKDLEGNELNPGDLVLANSEGKMVTPDNTLAYLDYMAANNIPILGPTLNQITVTHNNQTGKTTTSLGEDFEDRLKRLLLDPIANDSLLKLLWLELGELLWNLSHDKHIIDTRLTDKTANAKTPEALSIMSPALIGIAAILGFESATAMAAWAAAYPEAFTGIVGSTLGGEIINLATNLGSGGKYKDWGDAANLIWGTGETLGGFTNPGYFVNPLSKSVSAIGLNGKRLFDLTLAQLNGSWALRALNTATKYGLGEGVKAGIYNTAQSLLYGPEVAAKAGLNHLKLKILDAGWVLKNSIRSKDFYSRMNNSNYLNPDPLTYKPSDRVDAVKYLLMIENLNKYLGSHTSGPKGTIKYTKTVLPDKDILLEYDIPPALIEVSSSLDYFAHPHYRFVNPMDAKVGLVTSKAFTNALEDEILYGNAANVLALPFTRNTRHVLLFGGMSDLPLKSKEPAPAVNEINELLEGLGHVTGSLITYTNPYATHTPNDIDIITTESNLQKVIEKLLGTITSFPRNNHAQVDTPKYGTLDVQIIENAPGGNAKGKIALEIYLKLNPQAYYHNILETNNYVVPMSPEELLKVHKNNVLKFSNIDLLISGSEKHAQRNLNILRCPDQSIVKDAINTLESVYKTYLGPDFLSIEDLGVQLDYSNVKNNLEFLNKLGLANSELIAKDPIRMEYLIKSLLYLTHTANRTVAGVYDGYKLTTTDILKAMFTNGSGSNNGGNYARGKFGGDISYGKGDPYIGIVEFPVKHPEQLKTPMDVYNYLSKMIDVSEYIRNNYGLLELGNSYDGKFFSRAFIDNIFKDSMLDPETASEAIKAVKPTTIVNPYKTNLSSLVWYTVPNRNENLNIPMYFNWNYNPEIAEKLYLFNDNFANILDINHIYSLLPGFNDLFIGRYARYIPNIRSTVVKGSDNRNNYFSGFELPTMSFKSPKVTYESVRPAYELAYPMPSAKPIEKAREAAGRNNYAKLNKADKLRRDTYDIVLRLRSALYASIRNTKDNFKLATVLGAGGAGIYGISKLLNTEGIVAGQTARDIIKDVDYKNKKELKKYLDECEVYLTDELYNTLNDLANNGTLTEFHRELKDILYNYLKNSK